MPWWKRGACLVLLSSLGACAVMSGPDAGLQSNDGAAAKQGDAEKKSDTEKPKETGKKRPARSALHVILFYIPNRILDVFDIARAGVDVGPGVGVDLRATEFATIGLMARMSAGVGLQTLRHLPVKAAGESYSDIGPAFLGAQLGPAWYHNTWDLRAEVHALLVGAHACVNPGEIFDLIVGLLTFDPMNDDS